MAAPTINEMREALAATLETIPSTQVSAYVLANPTLPSIQIISGESEYDETFGQGMAMYNFKAQVMAGMVADIGAQKLLGRYADITGSYSIKAKLKAAPTLGGVVQHADIESVSDEQTYEMPSGLVIGRVFTIAVLAAGV